MLYNLLCPVPWDTTYDLIVALATTPISTFAVVLLTVAVTADDVYTNICICFEYQGKTTPQLMSRDSHGALDHNEASLTTKIRKSNYLALVNRKYVLLTNKEGI